MKTKGSRQANDPRRRPNEPDKKAAARRKSGRSLVVLDNPDDGEIYDTGDAADTPKKSK